MTPDMENNSDWGEAFDALMALGEAIRERNLDRYRAALALFALPEVVAPQWIPVRERLPEGDGDVLATHWALGVDDGHMGMAIRSAKTIRLWASDPSDISLMDAYWMELPVAPLLPQSSGEKNGT